MQTWRVRLQVYPRGRKMSRGPSEILQIDAGKKLRLMKKKRVRHNLFPCVLPNYRVACSQAIPKASCIEFDSARAISALTARRSRGTHPSGGCVLIEIHHAFNIMLLSSMSTSETEARAARAANSRFCLSSSIRDLMRGTFQNQRHRGRRKIQSSSHTQRRASCYNHLRDTLTEHLWDAAQTAAIRGRFHSPAGRQSQGDDLDLWT